MNLLEHYLGEIIEIEPLDVTILKNNAWAKSKNFAWITATFNCHGHITTTRRLYSEDEWQNIVDRGYYLG